MKRRPFQAPFQIPPPDLDLDCEKSGLVAGLIAVVNGGLNLAIANGGPGTGNGVVGGAAAFVLGLIALAIGRLALARCRLNPLETGRMT